MSIRSRFAILLLAGMVAAPVGCGKKTPAFPTDAATPVLPVPSTGPPVTEVEAMEFGKEVVLAVRTKDRAKFEKVLHAAEFWERCIQDLDFSSADRNFYLNDLSVQMGQMYEQIASTYDRDGDLTVLGVRPNNGKMECVLRLREEGVNYFVCTLARFPDASIGMEDWHNLSSGVSLSQMYRRQAIPLALGRKGGLSKVPQKDRAFIEHAKKLYALEQAVVKKDFDNAMKLFRSLPQELQDEKWIAWMGLIVSVGLDEAIYLQEIERFMKLFPDDPGLDLLTLGHWESKREWKRGLGCLERFDHFIGGDPYLNIYRTIFLIKLGRTTEAKVSASQLLAAEPKLEGSFYTMAYYLVMTKDYAGAVENYKQVVTKLGRSLALEQLLTDPDYSVFVKSKEYAGLVKWAEARLK